MLDVAGWGIQDAAGENLSACRGIALRGFPLKAGHGFADYLLSLDRKTCGVIEAKWEGTTLTGVEVQSEKYSQGLPTLPDPSVIAAEIAEDLRAALEQFEAIAGDLSGRSPESGGGVGGSVGSVRSVAPPLAPRLSTLLLGWQPSRYCDTSLPRR
jgi:hypothetical protein